LNIRVIVLLAMVLLMFWSFRSWRKAVKLCLVLVVVEGALRKWVAPQAQDLIYFVKDAMLLLAYAGFLVKVRSVRSYWSLPSSVALLLSFAAAYGALQIFNPELPSILLGLFGFRSYFIYVPLVLVLPAVFPTDSSLIRFLRRYLLLAIPTGLLACLQFFSPMSSPLNAYVRGGIEDVMSFGTSSYVRVTSTFSYISGYTSYLLASAILLLGVLAIVRWRFQATLYLGLGLTLVGMLMSGSRAPLYMLALLLPIYMMFFVVRGTKTATTVRALFAAGLLAAAIGAAVPEAIEAFRGRALGTTDTRGRILIPLIAPLQSLEHAGPFGRGIGATHQAGPVLLNVPEPFWLRGFSTEAESGRIMLELGPVGFLLIYAVRFYLVLVAVRAARLLKIASHRALALASLLFMLAQLSGTIVFDPVANIFFWFFVGLLNVVIRLDRAAVMELSLAARSALSPPTPSSLPLEERLAKRF
jgi:hypothetical protein